MNSIITLFKNTVGKLPPRALVLVACGIFFGVLFVRTATCDGGMLACGMTEFSLVSPLYILLAPFIETLSFPLYLTLFVLSSLIYSALLYSLAAWVESLIYKTRQRAGFTLKRVS